MIELRRGWIRKVEAAGRSRVELEVELDGLPGRSVRALAYPQLGDHPWREGQTVIVNTTAGSLGLGSGGFHFALPPPDAGDLRRPVDRRLGHIIKLRYTPLQFAVLACEEARAPYHRALGAFAGLRGLPVGVLSLHSMLGPAAAAFKLEASCRGRQLRVGYVMTDGACLAAAVSRELERWRRAGVVDLVVTAGQAFGGELEAVHPASALAACCLAGADAVFVGPGPGIVGTGTPLGTTAMEVATLSDLAVALGGRVVVALRLSSRDPRARHRGVSHHLLTALGRLAARRASVVIPSELERTFRRRVLRQLARSGILARHQVAAMRTPAPGPILERLGGRWESMGRSAQDDPACFDACTAAGAYLARLAAGR